VQDKIYDKFLNALHEKSVATIYGDPILLSMTKGPAISRSQRNRIMQYISKGKESGTKVLHGGDPPGEEAHFVGTTVFGDVDKSSSLMAQEIFKSVAVST
jgi:aldehyde dehydrogenase (NAD+)